MEKTMEILDYLINEGHITEEQAKDAIAANPTHRRMRICDTIHTLLCSNTHGEDGCLYFSEEQIEGTWEAREHRTWLKITKEVIDWFGQEMEEDDFERMLGKAMNRVEELRTTLSPQALDLTFWLFSLGMNVLIPNFGLSTVRCAADHEANVSGEHVPSEPQESPSSSEGTPYEKILGKQPVHDSEAS